MSPSDSPPVSQSETVDADLPADLLRVLARSREEWMLGCGVLVGTAVGSTLNLYLGFALGWLIVFVSIVRLWKARTG